MGLSRNLATAMNILIERRTPEGWVEQGRSGLENYLDAKCRGVFAAAEIRYALITAGRYETDDVRLTRE